MSKPHAHSHYDCIQLVIHIMVFSRSLLFVTFLLIAFVCNHSNASEENELLQNPGFEGASAISIAPGWKDNSGWADVDVEYSLSNDAIEGVSQYILGKRVASGAVQFVQQGAPLVAGQSYKVSIWMKGKVDSPVEVMLRERGTPYRTYASRTFRVSERWSSYEFVATSGVDDPGIYFMVRFTGKGELWLDQASIKKTLGQSVTTAKKKGNLIANGSFELGLDRWAVKVREEGGYKNEMSVAFSDVRPAITTAGVPQGKRALHIALPLHGRAIVTTVLSEITPGQRYTLSLWLKSGNSNTKVGVNLSAGWGDITPLGRAFVISPEWKRYEFSTIIPDNNYHLVIETREPSSDLWIDGVQLIAGEGKMFEPRVPVEIGFSRGRQIPLFYKNNQIELEFCVSSYNSAGGDYDVEITSTDFYGEKSLLLRDHLSFKAEKNVCQNISIPNSKTGHFQLQGKVLQANGTLVDSTTMAIGIVPYSNRVPSASSHFGGHSTFNPTSLNAMKMLGVSWLRMHPPLGTKWFIVEPEKNRFQFFDQPILYAKGLGFHILGSLDGTPRWASSAPNELQNEQADGYRAYLPENIGDWEGYVSRTVSHYKGVIDHWEIWNEPDSGGFFKLNGPLTQLIKADAYIELVKSAYRAAKKANQNSVIVAGVGTGKPPSLWAGALFEKGIADYIDVLSFHFYTDGRPGDSLDVTAGERVNELRLLMKSHGKPNTPIWETESGYAFSICDQSSEIDNRDYCATQNESVSFIIRNYVEWISSGVDHWFFYNMFFPDRTDRPEYTSFFGWDRSPTALAVAYAVASDFLAEMEYSQKFDINGNISGALFICSNKHVRVLWNKENIAENIDLLINSDARYAYLIDAMGNVIAEIDGGEYVSIAVNFDPVYVVEYFE